MTTGWLRQVRSEATGAGFFSRAFRVPERTIPQEQLLDGARRQRKRSADCLRACTIERQDTNQYGGTTIGFQEALRVRTASGSGEDREGRGRAGEAGRACWSGPAFQEVHHSETRRGASGSEAVGDTDGEEWTGAAVAGT